MYGPDHGARTGLPLLWSRAKKVCPLYDLGVHGFLLYNRIPMVFLGIFFGIQFDWNQWLYWRLATLWYDERPRNAVSWIASDP
jgi:hypothetical protein